MTKGELAQRILKILGINTRTSEASPEEVEDMLLYIEDWMSANSAIGRRIGFYLATGVPDPDDEAGIPNWAVMGVTNSVAKMVAPYYGKPADPTIISNAAAGMQTISARTVEVQCVQYPRNMPRGTGNKTPYGPNYYRQEDRIRTFNDYLTDEGDEPITS